MKSNEFEMKLIKRYGNGRIPSGDIEGILEEAVEGNVLEREEIGEYVRDGGYTVAELLQLMRKWRTDFLKDSFSINDMCSCVDVSVQGISERCKKPGNEDGGSPCARESFITTDDAFLSSLRDKTRIINERRSNNNKKMAKNVLKAWSEYEKLGMRRKHRYWYFLFPMLFVPLYFMYTQKPF